MVVEREDGKVMEKVEVKGREERKEEKRMDEVEVVEVKII